MKTSSIPRRKFLQITVLSGAGLAVGLSFIKDEKKTSTGNDESLPSEVNPYIFIDKSGRVTLYNHRPEMGQGTYETIPMIIAEELDVDINGVTILPSPADRDKYGDQAVYGSRSIRENYELMRKVGASAKEMLIAAAATKWNVSKEQCYAENGFVVNKNNNAKINYGELTEDAKKIPVPQNPKLKSPKNFKIIGKTISRKDVPLKTNGDAKFGLDIQLPGMLYASVERSPVLLGKIVSYDDAKAKAVAGVKYIVKTQRNVLGKVREGVAVVATNYWAAEQARKLLNVKWQNDDLEQWNTQNIKDFYAQSANDDGVLFDHTGDAKNAIDKAAIKIEASYELPYQAHATMEPMNVIVSLKKDSCEFWGSTQNPNGVKEFLAEKYKIPIENVKINYTFMGGGFGKRSMTDVAEEAAEISMQVGAPVKVVWSREDDLMQGPFRACQLNVCKGAVDANGNVAGLSHKVISQEIHEQYNGATKAGGQCLDGINTEYVIPNFELRAVLKQMYLPIYYWRSVYHSTNCFAHESFIDELAHAAKKDPLDFRLSLLTKHERYTNVLKTVAEKSNWYQPRESNTGKGVAIVERSGAFTAMVAEVKKINNKLSVTKITMAVDCGTPVNPGNIKAQMEGCVVMGLTAAYKSSINIQNGRVVENNFHNYKMLRIDECPEIEVHVIESTAAPEGAGEASLPTVAPAVTNAIFDLTKKRIRSLPFNINEV